MSTLSIDANPFGIYEDGRVESVWDDLDSLSLHLKKHQEEQWVVLTKNVIDILMDDMAKDMQAALESE